MSNKKPKAAAQIAESAPSATLLQQLAAISTAISAGCLVEANIGGTMRRVLGIQESKGVATLLYLNDQQQTTLCFVRQGSRMIFQVTLATQEAEVM